MLLALAYLSPILRQRTGLGPCESIDVGTFWNNLLWLLFSEWTNHTYLGNR